MTVFTGTWNLGNAAPSAELAWIPKGMYDIYAIGVQECIYAKRPGFVDCEQDWFLSVHHAVGMKDYECLAEQTLSPRTDKTYAARCPHTPHSYSIDATCPAAAAAAAPISTVGTAANAPTWATLEVYYWPYTRMRFLTLIRVIRCTHAHMFTPPPLPPHAFPAVGQVQNRDVIREGGG